ncbi:probable protein phosphatase 2C 60 [Tanacetum coccineum]
MRIEMSQCGPHSDFSGPTSGCTSCVAIMRGNQLVVANAGDSRCVISRKGELQTTSSPDAKLSDICFGTSTANNPTLSGASDMSIDLSGENEADGPKPPSNETPTSLNQTPTLSNEIPRSRKVNLIQKMRLARRFYSGL